MKNWLYGQTVVLSGASGGIGRELVKLLILKYNASVIGIGRSEEKMLALKKELGENASAFSYRLLDVSLKESWQALAKELENSGVRPVLLINNAGVFPPLQTALNSPSEITEKVIKTNFLSAVYAIEALSPFIVGNGKYKPAIINVSSSAALCSIVGAASYAASKAALKGYTEALQLEEKGKKYIGAIYPGTTATDLFRDDENVQNSAMGMIAMPADKMARKIVKRILKRKKRSVLGLDAKFMSFTARFMPVKGPAFIRWIMKISKSKAFINVFEDKK